MPVRPHAPRGLFCLLVVALPLLVAGCGENRVESSPGPLTPSGIVIDVDAGPRAQLPVALETRLGAESTRSGVANNVTCALLDPDGVALPGVTTRVEVQPDHGFEATQDGLVGHRAGVYQVRCVADELGLRDVAGAEWRVDPGPPARVLTEIDPHVAPADTPVTVSCAAFDEAGNPTVAPDGFEVDLAPRPGDYVWDDDQTVRVQTAGRYDLRCRVAGAEALPGEGLEVLPGAPTELIGRVEPAQRVYRPGQVVTVVLEARDAFGNAVVGAAPNVTARPALDPFGPGRFRLQAPGEYALVGQLGALHSSHTIRVVAGGPGIECVEPPFGAQINAAAGSRVRLEGRVVGNEARTVRVGGAVVPVEPDGRFAAEVPVTWGQNAVEIAAVDVDGGENSTFCAFFASERWLAEQRPLADAVALRLGGDALDDGDPDRPLRSLADVLRRVVRSSGLRDALHDALRAQNPIVPTECRTRVGPVCIFSFGAEYRDLSLRGPHDLRLELVNGGLRVDATLRNIEMVALMRGTLGNQGTFDVDRVRVTLVFDVGRSGTRPHVQLRAVERLEVGDLSADFSGFITGAILDLAFAAFEGVVRRVLVDNVRRYLVENIDGVLTDLLDNFDLGALALGFDVPSVTGGAPLRLTFDAGLSTVDLSSGHAIFGLQTKVTGPSRLAGGSRGVAIPPGAGGATPPATAAVGAAVSVVLVNQVLHALWRGAFFEADARSLAGAVTASLPVDLDVRFTLPQPPAAAGVAGQSALRLHIGPAELSVGWPGVFPAPVTLRAAAIARVAVSVRGTDLRFDDLQIERLHFALVDGVAPGESRQVLEDAVRSVLEGLLRRALTDGLPELPIPAFEVPPGLQRFGLSPGTTLGLRDPRLTGEQGQWSIEGRFGE